jgi:methionyl-tRNA formyltransferase
VAICQGDAARNIRIKGVVIQAPLGKKSLRALVSQMLGFYGWFDFLRMGVRFAVSKVMNKIAVKLFHGRFPGAFSVEHVLLKAGWPILHTRSVNTPEFREQIAPLQLDLIQSVAASQKFGAELLKAPRYGCINIHNAKLPLNRGMLPNFWSLYNTDREPVSGMTVHLMNEKLDDGPIVLQEEMRPNPAESLHALILRTKRLNAHLVLRALNLFVSGPPPMLPNDATKATYNTFPTREDVRNFKAKGLRLL